MSTEFNLEPYLKPYLYDDILTIILARHGEPGPPPPNYENPKNLIENPLTKRGFQQAEKLAERLTLVPLDAIYCSDMARSYQTASVVSVAKPDVPMEVITDLREVSSFHFQDKEPARIEEELELVQREQASAERVVKKLLDKHKIGQTIAVIAHGGRNRMILSTLLGIPQRELIPMPLFHAAITVVAVSAKRKPYLILANCTRHLPTSLVGMFNLSY